MKATLKNIAFTLVFIAVVIAVLVAVDNSAPVRATSEDTYLRVAVVDLDDKPVHNAQITVGEHTFFTDNKGLSPNIMLVNPSNSYDSTISEWYTANVFIKKDGYVPAAVFNCVVYDSQTRKLTVKIYPKDASDLPYVCYVESPPNDFVTGLLGNDAKN